jgi:hypothetical protein
MSMKKINGMKKFRGILRKVTNLREDIRVTKANAEQLGRDFGDTRAAAYKTAYHLLANPKDLQATKRLELLMEILGRIRDLDESSFNYCQPEKLRHWIELGPTRAHRMHRTLMIMNGYRALADQWLDGYYGHFQLHWRVNELMIETQIRVWGGTIRR